RSSGHPRPAIADARFEVPAAGNQRVACLGWRASRTRLPPPGWKEDLVRATWVSSGFSRAGRFSAVAAALALVAAFVALPGPGATAKGGGPSFGKDVVLPGGQGAEPSYAI